MSTPRGQDRVTALSQCPLFTALPLRVLHALAPRFQAIELDPGQALFTPGAESRSLYIIEAGSLKFESKGEVVHRVERGAFFCESSVIMPRAHRTQCKAVTPAVVLEMNAEVLAALWNMEPSVAAFLQLAIGSRLITELRRANEQLVALCEWSFQDLDHQGLRELLMAMDNSIPEPVS